MDLAALGRPFEWVLGLWLALIVLTILIRMLTGHIILTGLFRREKHAPFGLDRIQLVFVTLFFAGGYLVVSLGQVPGEGLPTIPTPLLLILIGSNGTYLAVKYAALLGGPGRGK